MCLDCGNFGVFRCGSFGVFRLWKLWCVRIVEALVCLDCGSFGVFRLWKLWCVSIVEALVYFDVHRVTDFEKCPVRISKMKLRRHCQ